jgi:hypothetical protein
MRDVREFSAQTGEAMRWFIYTFALFLPWLAFVMLGPWLTMATTIGCVAFWLWWIHPPVGLNRQPLTWLLTVGLILVNAMALLLSTELLQSP